MVTLEPSLVFDSGSETWAVLISSFNQFNELLVQAVPYTLLIQDNPSTPPHLKEKNADKT